jgi:opacity protein-like surface antigen
VRYRFQVGNGRIVPYALAGGGLGWAQINDRRVTSDVYPLVNETHTSVVGSVGGGIEYMLNRNAAIGVESRYIFGFKNDVVVGGTKGTLDNSSLLVLAQLRLLFP